MHVATKIVAMLCTIILSTLMMQEVAVAGESVGVRQFTAPYRERGINLDVTVWYPASSGGKSVTMGESMFFVGTSAMLDAPIADGTYPLIILSHGAGLAGNAQALSWIATPLARQGFVVVAPTHPGNTGANRSAAETMKLWLRPADLTETLDAVEKNPIFEEHLAHGKVGALGLSMGGSTALMIAGARLDPRRLADYCDTDALNPSLCEWVKRSGIDLHSMDLSPASRDNEDKRVLFALAVDPVPIDVFDDTTFSKIQIPVEIINLGRPGKIPPTAQASEIIKSIPQGTYHTIEDASHYSMFAECKPDAAEIAKVNKIEDPICTDSKGRSRNEIHAQLIDMITTAFTHALKEGH